MDGVFRVGIVDIGIQAMIFAWQLGVREVKIFVVVENICVAVVGWGEGDRILGGVKIFG